MSYTTLSMNAHDAHRSTWKKKYYIYTYIAPCWIAIGLCDVMGATPSFGLFDPTRPNLKKVPTSIHQVGINMFPR